MGLLPQVPLRSVSMATSDGVVERAEDVRILEYYCRIIAMANSIVVIAIAMEDYVRALLLP
ncbi:hypothetical protein COLO4_00021 [Corchorus olitorius]|uniref:Uncharacterized protein n=1 Tax=Corchorus olitorius TaxID=93759 RepID=A0A1R3L4U8_9ROSI|nr:hypothetical protein COLO4_00021 [Corchorus olitorius]